MFIASKYEEMYPPEINDFVYITDQAYTKAQIRQMEVFMLKGLGYCLGKPLCLHFLRRNSKAAGVGFVIKLCTMTFKLFMNFVEIQSHSYFICNSAFINNEDGQNMIFTTLEKSQCKIFFFFLEDIIQIYFSSSPK